MRTTTLGRDGPVVGRLGLGAMGLSYRYAPGLRDRTKAVSLVQEAVTSGSTSSRRPGRTRPGRTSG